MSLSGLCAIREHPRHDQAMQERLEARARSRPDREAAPGPAPPSTVEVADSAISVPPPPSTDSPIDPLVPLVPNIETTPAADGPSTDIPPIIESPDTQE